MSMALWYMDGLKMWTFNDCNDYCGYCHKAKIREAEKQIRFQKIQNVWCYDAKMSAPDGWYDTLALLWSLKQQLGLFT